MIRPGLENILPEVTGYIEHLEDRLSQFEGKSMAKMYAALDRKLTKLAEIVDEYELSDSILTDKDDKSFDRLVKIAVESKDIMANLSFLEEKLNIRKAQEEKKAPNPAENRANAKRKNQ